MREFSVPAVVEVADTANLTDMVFDRAGSEPDRITFARLRDGGWTDVTAAQFAGEVRRLAKGLVAAGIEPGERVAIMSRTRYEWTLVDYAVWTAGGVPVPIYETSSAEQVQWILTDSGVVAVVVGDSTNAATVGAVRDRAPTVRAVWTLDDGAVEELSAAGVDIPDRQIEARRRGVRADDLATVIYTSGTTGRPKGCELSHRNLLFEVMTVTGAQDTMLGDDAGTLLFLPLAHVVGRVLQCSFVYSGARLGHTSDIKNLLPQVQSFRPTVLIGIPRVFEKVYNGARQRAHAEGKGRIFDAAEHVAIAHSEAQDTGRRIPLALTVQHRLFDRLVYARLRAALGGRCTSAICGSAPLGERLGHFFRGIGLYVFEGYGLTETTAAATINTADATRIGTVGRPLPGVSLRVADDGEVWIKGGIVFSGYRGAEQATADALQDGWFGTGDLGGLDEQGYLRITGRKKEIIVTSAGKNVSPAVLEDRLRAHPLISQCMVVGDRRPFIAALITLDVESLPAWNKEHGNAEDTPAGELREDPALRGEIQCAVDDANKAVSRAESIRSFRVLGTDFSEAAGEITPSMKIKRAVVLDRYAGEIAAIYG